MLTAICHCGAVRVDIPRKPRRMGVNARNLAPAAIAGVRVRNFDGATTCKFLD